MDKRPSGIAGEGFSVGQQLGGVGLLRWAFWLIAIATTLYFALARFDLNYNSYYLDEYDYLFVGQWLNSGLDWPTKHYVFGSELPLRALGFAESLFGAPGGRYLAAFCGFASLLFFYFCLSEFGTGKALAALLTAVLSLQVGHLAISRMATYDIISYLAICICLFLISRLHRNSLNISTLPLSIGLLLAAAVLAKYIAII